MRENFFDLSLGTDCMFYIILVAILVAVDQVIKILVRTLIPLGGSVPLIPHIMGLTYLQNTGAAFSLFEERTWLLALISIVIVVVISVLLITKVLVHPLGAVPAVMVIAGGIGNLIDRFAFGFVTDMFQTLFVNFAIFNFADICVTVGGIMLIIYVLFFYDKFEKKAKGGAGQHADESDLSSGDT